MTDLDLDLDAIQTRADLFANTSYLAGMQVLTDRLAATAADVPALVARVRHLRAELEWPSIDDLADAHSRFHGQAGNLMYEDGCVWVGCQFWESVTHLLSLRPGSSDSGSPS